MATAWWLAGGLAIVTAAAVFQVSLGIRPDFAAVATGSLRFVFKFVITVSLAAAAFVAAQRLSGPEAAPQALRWLVTAPLLLAVAVGIELLATPAADWAPLLIGENAKYCLTYIPLIGIGPLAAFIAVLRHGAPIRPALAGAVAGLLAGGLAATLYGVHCTDDSPLFVAVWYSLAIAGLAGAGARLARLFVRW